MRSCLLILLLILTPTISAQSLEKAKLLHANRMYEDAKREAVAVVFSEAADGEKADALSLLGTIAVDQGDYETAIRNWTELTTKFPGTPAALDAVTKISLAKKLLPRERPADVPSDSSQDEGAVLVAGVAPEHPQYADQAVLEFMNFLSSNRVKTANVFAGRVSDATRGRVSDVSLPNVLAHAKKVKATSVLYVYIHFRGMENMRAECYSSDGRKLWQEKVAASFGMSPSGMTEGFVKRMKGKLAKHLGGSCLPRTVPPL
jgi:hypothetical protein